MIRPPSDPDHADSPLQTDANETVLKEIHQGFEIIEGLTNFERRSMDSREYRLDRMSRILEEFGNPHLSCKILHVAGSKGKGSVSTLLAAGLSAMGHKTGLYRSPHIRDYRERFTLAGVYFSPILYRDALRQILPRINSLGSPTTFELLTLLGFLLFSMAGCTWAVIEVGLGGRLDATNLVDPVASIITPIELEHTDILGTTIPAIAGEKAGIIKNHRRVYIFPQGPDAEEVFQDKAQKMNAPLVYPLGSGPESLAAIETHLSWQGCRTNWNPGLPNKSVSLELPVPGRIHGLNALFAYTILEDLNVQQLVTGSLGRAKCGIEAVSIPGRMDLKYITRAQGGGIRCVLDGAHTPASAALLAENLRTLGATGITLLIGVVDGKDAKGILTQFANIVDHVIITPPGSFKKSSPSTLVETCQELHIPYQVVDQAGDALNQGVATTENSGTLLCTGSFYLLGEISPLLDALAEKITPEVV